MDENSYRALQRSRESEVWGRVVDLVGPPADGVRFVHVFDRGADNIEVFCHCRAQRTDGVIRAAQWHRVVEEADEEQVGERDGAKRLSLRAVLATQPLWGTCEPSVGATKDHEARTARLQVRFARVTIRRPQRRTKYQRAVDFQELTQWVVETREVDPRTKPRTAMNETARP